MGKAGYRVASDRAKWALGYIREQLDVEVTRALDTARKFQDDGKPMVAAHYEGEARGLQLARAIVCGAVNGHDSEDHDIDVCPLCTAVANYRKEDR